MFLQYMRDHRKLLFLLALLVIIFTVVFALYQIPAVPALWFCRKNFRFQKPCGNRIIKRWCSGCAGIGKICRKKSDRSSRKQKIFIHCGCIRLKRLLLL